MPLLSVFGVFVLGVIIFIIYGSKTDRSGVISNYGFLSFLFKGESSNKDESRPVSSNLSDDISNINAEIVVPLLGDETSTEMLVEMASSINDKSKFTLCLTV